MRTLRLKSRCGSAARRRVSAFTLLELLIAVIILGILVSIVTVVYTNRAADARLSAAREDLSSIVSAQEHAVIDTGYYFRLYVLNDTPDGDNIGTGLANDRVDGIQDEDIHGPPIANNTQLFIQPGYAQDASSRDGEFVAAAVADNLWQRLDSDSQAFGWKGPYINFTRYTGLIPPAIAVTTTYGEGEFQPPPPGMPLDPWGNPYIMFTQKGVVREPDGVIDNQTRYVVFDRPTVLSLGPNGAPGNGLTSAEPNYGQGDDLYKQF